MVQFDRIKVKTIVNCIENFNDDCFKPDEDYGRLESMHYSSVTSNTLPYPFKVQVDVYFDRDELIIDLPAKILLDDYPLLISSKTLEQCIDQLHQLGIMEIDFTSFLANAELLSCDVTKDIPILLSNREYQLLIGIIKNDNKWKGEPFGNGVLFQNRLSTPRLKVTLEFYGKEHELELSKNKSFLNMLQDQDKLMDVFAGRTRVELKLRSMYVIRTYFNHSDTNLIRILTCGSNPFVFAVDQIFDLGYLEAVEANFCNTKWKNVGEYKNYLVVKESDFDINKVRQIIKMLYSKKTNLRSALRPYKEIINQHKNIPSNKTNDRILMVFDLLNSS